ncbi:hypothetical protein JOC75_003977 [Metabacillus crassostreae]|uniref:hypothetical protein n=1 Tax=Metabacillus crassostreae TaxID=929098 RepID=UPI00195DAF16|nr:hypothetical protein [Metabacillus crassostreae]MBM7605949.1 hypothetical protein [Metabacillus crassostreae]
MIETIECLYDEIHGPKITPYELLENVKLPNYISVDFSTDSNNNIVAYTKCLLEHGDYVVFTYVFDKDNKLLSLKSTIYGIEDELYNRKTEIEKFYQLASQSLKPILKAI